MKKYDNFYWKHKRSLKERTCGWFLSDRY